MAASRCGRCSDELTEIVIRVETSNDPAFGTTGAKLRDALLSLDRTSRWLLERVTSAPNEALAGATPYLRLFGSTLGGCMLAGEALAARDLEGAGDPAALCHAGEILRRKHHGAGGLAGAHGDGQRAKPSTARMRCCWRSGICGF